MTRINNIIIERTEDQIKIKSDFHPDLPYFAKRLAGKFENKSWVFDIRDEENVKKLYIHLFGYFDADVPCVDAKVTALRDYEEDKTSIYFAGRQVARAYSRDSGATLGDGIIVLEGNFSSGGSVKHWVTRVYENTVFEIRDVPLSKIEEEKAGSSSLWKIEILDNSVDKKALQEEKTRLLQKIAEIDELLK